MRNNISKLALVAIFGFALAFTFSCGNGGNGGGDEQGGPSDENSQVYNRKNGALYKGSGDIKIGHTINAGSVTKGIAKLDLSRITIPDEYLGDYFSDDIQRSCDDYPIGIKLAKVDYFTLYYSNSDDELLGRLRIEYLDLDEQIWEGIIYLYSSEAGKITCNLASDRGSLKINTDIEEGWNKIYARLARNSEEWSTDNILTKEVKWTIER
ncbi:MAG: hypothetical protein LBC87_06055 [Fibromonadaceae bacterium]|jgi:hypothetical protein|nr:hypothetical protein [Fibromonadaceae bacterium]